MTANSFLEVILVMFGWMLNNAFWNILLDTGLFVLPVVFKVLGIWLKVREEGADEGNKGVLALPRIENAVYMAYCVMLFCCYPLFPVDIQTIEFDDSRSKQCGVNLPSPANSRYSALINDFNGRTAEVPLWWYATHLLSKGATQAMIAAIPCGTQMRQLRFEVQNTKLRDPILVQEVQDFANQCYSRAYYRLKSRNSQLSDATISAVGWIGSSYFLNTTGYYDEYTSATPRSQWPYDNQRDNGYPDVGRGGYPTCKQWWSDRDIGLKDRVLANLSADTKKRMQKFDSREQWEETTLRWLVSPRNVSLSSGGESYAISGNDNATGLTGNITRLVSSVGLGLKQAEALPGFDAMKQALPMIQALVLMLIIIVTPVLMMFSAYEPKTIVTITFAMFAVMFISFWWELAGWLDDRLITLLYDNMAEQGLSSSVPFADFMSSINDGWMMNLVLGMMYLVFPVVWIGMFSWIGVHIGNGVQDAMEKGAKNPQEAGAKAGRDAQGSVIDGVKGK